VRQQIDILKKQRLAILNEISLLSLDQLNDIPTGFNNNILWNLGHMVSTQHGVCYKPGAVLPIDQAFFDTYKSRTKPEKIYSQDDLSAIKELFISTLDHLEAQIENGAFTPYTSWTTREGFEIRNIDDAVRFLTLHEGIHSGTIIALKKLVSPKLPV